MREETRWRWRKWRKTKGSRKKRGIMKRRRWKKGKRREIRRGPKEEIG